MKRSNEIGLRNYIKENLAKGYSLEQIRDAIIRHGYSESITNAIIADYQDVKKGKYISNNILAVITILFMLVSVMSNYYIISNAPKLTGMLSYNTTGAAAAYICVNTKPVLNISDCGTEANVTEEYYCVVNASDANWNYTVMRFTYFDNTSMFNITNTSEFGAEINFTPRHPDYLDINQKTEQYYAIELKVSDGSTCSNENDTEILGLWVRKGCSVKYAPVFNNLSTNYTIPRNYDWLLQINATDVDFEDGINYSVSIKNYSAYSSLATNLKLNSSTGLLNISPNIKHVGWHLLNITVTDNSTCINKSANQLVNITVSASNSAPRYIGQSGELDYTWDEDTVIYNVYNLDDYFNDSDGDCLKYELEYVSADPFVTVSIYDNVDPRLRCSHSHWVTLTPEPNQFGDEWVYIEANDTINVSEKILVKYTVNNIPEPITLPPGASTSPGAGGGAAAFPKSTRCEEKWYCKRWGSCTGGYMYRNCTDLNECHTSKFRPNETMKCTFIEHCNNEFQDYDEEGIDCGGSCPAECSTCYDALMNCHILENKTELCEEGIDCGGPCKPCTEEEKVIQEEIETPAPEIKPKINYWFIVLLIVVILLLISWLLSRRKKKAKKEGIKHSIHNFVESISNKIYNFRKKITIKRKSSPDKKEQRDIKKNKAERITAKFYDIFRKHGFRKGGVAPLDIEKELQNLANYVGKEDNELILQKLGNLMRQWLSNKLNIEPGMTFEEIKQKHKIGNVEPFFDELIEVEYSGTEVAQTHLRNLLNEALRTVRHERKGYATSKKQKKLTNKKVLAIVFILVAMLSSLIFIFNPDITGRLIQETYTTVTQVNQSFTSNDVYKLSLTNLNMNSVKLTGEISTNSNAKIYIGKKNNNYLIFDSLEYIAKRNMSRRGIKTDQVKELIEGEKIIDLKIDYKNDTQWDKDNDGIVFKEEAIDISIKDTLFSWNLDKSKLCTLWAVSNIAGREAECYGSIECCSLFELTPSRDEWDDTLYLTYAKLGASEENIVSAKLIYANYSLEEGNAYSEIVESETENISAIFENKRISFEDVCLESCSISNIADDRLIVEISTGEIYIDKVTYSRDEEELLNNPPKFLIIPNITIIANSSTELDLADYASDADGDNLVYTAYEVKDINISLRGGVAVITPAKWFIGKGYTFFVANDSKDIGISNIIEIQVIEGTLNKSAEIASEADFVPATQVETDRPVIWKKTFEINNANLSINISGYAYNISVLKIGTGIEKEISEQVLIREDNIQKNLNEYNKEKKNKILNKQIREKLRQTKKLTLESLYELRDLLSAKIDYLNESAINATRQEKRAINKNIRKISRLIEQIERSINELLINKETNVSVTENDTIEITEPIVIPNETQVIIQNTTQEMEITYVTDGPIKEEESISLTTKRIIISSDVPYTNILAYTDIMDSPRGAIKLYWLVNDTRTLVENAEYLDLNNNSLIDRVTWLVPHLSNQTYEVEITILNVQSYPTVGGNWTVMFNTTGTANLTITAINGTTWTNYSDIDYDLKFLEIRCGETLLQYEWSGSNCNESGNCSVFIEQYSCNETGYETSKVLTEGKHTLEFDFGGQKAYANNYASVNGTNTNLSIWDDTDTNNNMKSTDTVRFYANYTNATGIINGTCEVKFNFTGNWEGATNMTYNGLTLPWNYSRTIPYKGTTYFNVLCYNSSMDGLNATDSISIINSKPVINDTEGRLQKIFVYEDTLYVYNFSKNVSDPDLNDNLTYGYRAPHPFPDDTVFEMDYTRGLINFTASVNSHAGEYDFVILAIDTEASSSTTLPVNITAVNDIPSFSSPSPGTWLSSCNEGSLCQQTFTISDEESNWPINFTLNATPLNGQTGNITINRTTSNTMIINFTPTQAHVGNYTLNVTINDSGGGFTYGIFNLSIVNLNQAPIFDYVCNNSRSAVEDIRFNCTINATDVDLDTLAFTSNVSWFTINAISSNNALANFTPLNQHVGNYTVNITVSDGQLSTSTLINFTVNNSDDAPWLYNITNQIAVVNREYTYIAPAHDDDFEQPNNMYNENSENLSFGINNSWIQISKYNATAARINFTPSEGQKGNYTIMINVTDRSLALANVTFNLTIRNNTAPVFDYVCNNSRLIQENVSFNCFVNASDLGGDNFTFSANASWFNISSTTGNVSLVANDSIVGNHTINITVTDIWQFSNSVLVIFEVNNTIEAPVFFNVSNMTATQNILFTYDLSKNVSDEDMNTPQGDVLRYYVNYSLPSGLLRINETTGLINFTPNLLDPGSYMLNFTVNDSYGLKAHVIVNFTVINTNDAPSFDYVCDNERSAVEDVPFNCTINATDPDNNTLTFSANATWFNITNISRSSAIANFTPLNAQVGNHTINITVTDGQSSVGRLINFTVNNTNDAPVLGAIGNLQATEDTTFSFDVNASDDDLLISVGEVLTFRTNSTLFIINSATGYFNFTPNSTQVGNYTIIFNVTDLAGASDNETINFTIISFNDAPALDAIPNFVVEEGSSFYYDINATDEEDGNDAAGLLRYSWNHTSGWFGLNATSGIINFTANSTMIGVHTLNLSVNDTGGKNDWQLFNITILSLNFKPNITQIRPYGTPLSSFTVFDFANRSDFPNNITSITLNENTSVLFNHTSIDGNGDALNSSWYKDSVLVYTTLNNSYYYIINFTESEQHNITLIISDGRGGNDSFTWNITVNNTNRETTFGETGHSIYGDLRSGAFAGSDNKTNTTSGGIILAKNGAIYYTSGEFISNSINIGPLVSSFYNPIGFTNISWSAVIPDGTNVSLQTRTSQNDVDWGNWSIDILGRSYLNDSGEQIVSENATYIQYKLILWTNDTSKTPNVTKVSIKYIQPDLNMSQGDMNPNWIDLGYYFYDLDTDDELAYSVSNTSHISISINNITHVVSITAPSDWYGSEVISFKANDSFGITEGNNLTVTVVPTESVSAVEYVYVSHTRTVMRTRTRTIVEPRYLEILSPKHITAFSYDTVVAPIVIKNNGEAILSGVELKAEVNSELVNIWLSKDSFASIAPGQIEKTDLFIKWEGTISEFDIIVNATSTDPVYSDSAIVSVTGVARVETNRSIEESQIEFVRDLLNNNPECLELTELLEEAEKSLEEGDYAKSRNSLNFVIEGCKYLITSQKEVERPTPIEKREEDLFKLISGILLLLLFIALVIIVALANRRVRRI